MFGKKIKYIRYRNSEGMDTAAVFPEWDEHASVAKKLKPVKVYSAGFLNFTKNKEGDLEIKCYGKSVSLGIESEEKDSFYLTQYFLGLEYSI